MQTKVVVLSIGCVVEKFMASLGYPYNWELEGIERLRARTIPQAIERGLIQKAHIVILPSRVQGYAAHLREMRIGGVTYMVSYRLPMPDEGKSMVRAMNVAGELFYAVTLELDAARGVRGLLLQLRAAIRTNDSTEFLPPLTETIPAK